MMRNFHKEQLATLLPAYKREMALLNDWCRRNGFDFKRVADSYNARLVDFGAAIATQKRQA